MTRVVWVSFDVVGRDCLLEAAAAGAEVVGVVTLPGPVDPDRSGQCAFDEAAARLGAQLIETPDVNDPATVAAVAALEPELTFVVGWSQLVRGPFIETASRGVYGMHPTLLPAHRGRAPIPWSIILGLTATGVTLFQIVDPTADSGPIVGQVVVPIARRRDGDDALRAGQRRPPGARAPLRAGAARGDGAARAAGRAAGERLAEAHAGRRHRRLDDARGVPRRLGAGADPSLPGRVHVPGRRQGRALARAGGGRRRRRAGRHRAGPPRRRRRRALRRRRAAGGGGRDGRRGAGGRRRSAPRLPVGAVLG